MQADTFLVALHEGYWRIGYDDQWYGTYHGMVAAAVSAMRIARVVPRTRVVVRKADGSETIIWDYSVGPVSSS